LVIPLSQRRCLYTHGRIEAERYRRRHRPQAGDGSDCDTDAIAEWNRHHWWNWASERYLEHITGRVFWEQFGERHFDILSRLGLVLEGQGRLTRLSRLAHAAGAVETRLTACSAEPSQQERSLLELLEESLARSSSRPCGDLVRELEKRIEGLGPSDP
jgi:hypothetical protein